MKDLFGNEPSKLTFREWELREGAPLYRAGVTEISTSNLIAYLLRDHSKGSRLLDDFGDLQSIADAPLALLKKVKGIGYADAERLKVAFELSRRLQEPELKSSPQIKSPRDVFNLLEDEMNRLKQEILKLLVLNTKNRVTHIETVFKGSLNASVIHPREIYHVAIQHAACGIIVAHNHPSGDVTPSKEDTHSTKELAKVGTLMQIPLMDHVIIGGTTFYSFKEEGIL